MQDQLRVLSLADLRRMFPRQQLERPASPSPADYMLSVAGDSMVDTLQPGDRVRCRRIGIELPALGPDDAPFPLARFGTVIQSGHIYHVSVNDDGGTIKRAYTFPDDRDHWALLLVADNPHAEWGSRGIWYVRRRDSVRFEGEILGRA